MTTKAATLSRGFQSRHIRFIALGSAIGTGLFYGSSASIKAAGPAVLLAYLIGGAAVFLVLRSLGEMAVSDPCAGSFGEYATKYLGPLAGFATKSAYQWHQLWREGGVGALTSRGPSGSRCRLSQRCLEKPAVYLEQGPAAHGWVEDHVWTAARVATLIGRKFHVSCSVSGATRLMHRLGFSPQVPVRRVAERDERAVRFWKEATWAEVKEPGRSAGAIHLLRGRGRLHPPAAQRTHLGPARGDTAGDGERTTLGTAVRGRTDRRAARLPYPAVPPPAHPLLRQGHAPQNERTRLHRTHRTPAPTPL